MCQIVRKFDINNLYICPPHMYTVATLPWEIQKRHFSTVLFIHTLDYLYYLRRKQTVYSLTHHIWKMLPHYLVKCTTLSSFSLLHTYRVPGYQSAIRTSCTWKRIVATWAEFQQSVVDDAVDQWRKDWKHVSVQKVVTLNICCNGACLTFHLPHITTGFFQSH